ncbi:hypothetical protein ECG_00670 [Echinococcus granulosus]|nr:hypothetical protein ECG_00670 [Echinococcus granulosus]
MARFETTLQRPNARTVPLPRQIGTLPNTLSGAASDANSQNGGVCTGALANMRATTRITGNHTIQDFFCAPGLGKHISAKSQPWGIKQWPDSKIGPQTSITEVINYGGRAELFQ